MKTPAQAICWELWRTSRLEVLTRIGMASVFVLLVHTLSKQRESTEYEAPVICGILVMILMSAGVTSLTWILQFDRAQPGFTFRGSFVRPVSTWMLVALPLGFTLTTSAICFVVPALLSRWLGLAIPVLGPLVLVWCAVVCLVSASWSPATILGKSVGIVSLIAAAVILVFVAHRDLAEPWLMAMGRPEYFHFDWRYFVVLLLIATVAFAITVTSVARQRHGDRLLSLAWVRPSSVSSNSENSVTAASHSMSYEGRLFATSVTAQCWYEFRRFGVRTLLFAGVMPPAVLALVVIYAAVKPSWTGSNNVWLIALLISPIIYQIIGIDGAIGLRSIRGALKYPVFDAVRPMSSEQMIETKLVVIAACSLLGWLCMLAACGIHILLSGNTNQVLHGAGPVAETLQVLPLWSWALMLLAIAMSLISTTSMLLALWLWMPLHPNFCTAFTGLGIVHVLLFSWDASHDWALHPLWQTYGYLMPLLLVGVCAFVLWKARLARILRTRLFAVGAAVWFAYVVTTGAVLWKFAPAIPVEIPGQAYAAGLATVLAPLAAVAFAPLALNQHRHH